MMVGAITVLSMVDPARYPLSNAVGLAERSRAYFDAHHSYGQPGFDLLWAENLLWTAAVYHNAAFSALARVTLQRAIAAGPKGQSDLLTSSSESALRQLGKLPSTKWGDLLYVT
jgi:hypothetical protein